MKTAIRIIAAGLAASLALVSCAKQDAIDNGSTSPADGVRTIAVSFANASVKSELGEDGLTPKFVANDVIKVSNGTTAENCTVSTDGSGNASITTSLTGTLTMVYPSTAAKMNGNAIDGILVPTVQDGTFASANICKATIAADATSATFDNQTAVFKVTPPSGVKQFTITSLKPVVDGVARTGTAVAINTEGADDAAKLVITAGGDASSLTTFFVSIVAGANLTDLSFEYMTDETHGAMKGIPAKSIQAPVVDKTAASTLYTIDANNWHEYVVLEGKKWSTMNVGATTLEDCGYYFFWGGTEGYERNSSSKWVMASGDPTPSPLWQWRHTPYQTEDVANEELLTNFTKYTGSMTTDFGTTDGKTTLELKDDAANVNWGGSWRMPTLEEFEALFAIADQAWDDTKKGYTFGVSPAQIFLPAAGQGYNAQLRYTSNGYYWSSSLHSPYPCCASHLKFTNSSVEQIHDSRRYGESVRPVSD